MLPTAHTNATMMENATLSQIPPTLPVMVKKCFIRRITFREAVDITGGERRNATTIIINSTVAKTNANSGLLLLTARPPPSLSSLNV